MNTGEHRRIDRRKETSLHEVNTDKKLGESSDWKELNTDKHRIMKETKTAKLRKTQNKDWFFFVFSKFGLDYRILFRAFVSFSCFRGLFGLFFFSSTDSSSCVLSGLSLSCDNLV